MQIAADCRFVSPKEFIVSESILWPEEPGQGLLVSLEKLGQITPVLAQPVPDGFILLAGYKRVRALLQLRRPVLTLLNPIDPTSSPPSWPPPIKKALVYLASNCAKKPTDLNIVLALRFFLKFLTPENIPEDFFLYLQQTRKSPAFARSLAWASLPEKMLKHLREGRLSLESGPLLLSLAEEEWPVLEPLWEKFRLSGNYLTELLTNLRKAARMSGENFAWAAEKIGLKNILEAKLSPNDTLNRLSQLAKTLAFPESSKMENLFKDICRKLTQGSKIKISPSPAFETDQINISIFGPEDRSKLIAILQSPAFLELWKLANGPGNLSESEDLNNETDKKRR